METCPECGEERALELRSGVCVRCSLYCEQCSQYFHPEEQATDVVGHEGCSICEDCTTWCDDCDQPVIDYATHMADYHDDYEEDDEGEYVPEGSIAETNDGERMRVLNYSYKPDPVFFGHSDEGLYFGVEHEMEFPRGRVDLTRGDRKAAALAVIHRFNEQAGSPFYVKSDSSIIYGFEMVSHPFTREWFDTSYPQEMIRELGAMGAGPKEGGVGTDTAGIHIHVSRDAFSTYHMYKFLHFHYEFSQLVQRVAGRTGSHYASFDRDKYGTVNKLRPDGTMVKSHAAKMRALAGKKTTNMERYMAVNLQNDATVELRYFRSTGKIERLRAYIQFVDAVYHYTKDSRMSKKAAGKRIMSEADFLAWVRENEARFPDLVKLFARDEAYKPD